jgi:hypothetical protein
MSTVSSSPGSNNAVGDGGNEILSVLVLIVQWQIPSIPLT